MIDKQHPALPGLGLEPTYSLCYLLTPRYMMEIMYLVPGTALWKRISERTLGCPDLRSTTRQE